jgi:tetratricopeptide (TPR) repeat protein
MRAYVFTDRALAKHAGQFVWLGINGEKAVNAEFLRRYKVPAYPTYYVIDPVDGATLIRWTGGASVAQLDQFFGEQSAAYARRRAGSGRGVSADAVLTRADSLYGAAQYAEAAAAFGSALAMAPPSWPQYGRAVDARLFSLSEADSSEACVALAESALPRVRHTTSAGNVAGSGLGCALQLPKEAPRRAERVAALEKACREVLADTTLKLSGDDRSGLYIGLLDARDDANDSLGHQAVAGQWSAYLDGEAAKAKTPEARAVYDPHRLSAYIEIGHAERAIPMLEQSARDFPDDYNPPARLALAYRALKRWDEALAASDVAMSKAYGPRKLTFYTARSDMYVGKGDKDAAIKTLEEALAYAQALPEGQRSKNTIASLQKRIDKLKTPPTGP